MDDVSWNWLPCLARVGRVQKSDATKPSHYLAVVLAYNDTDT